MTDFDRQLSGSQRALRDANKIALLKELLQAPEGRTARELAADVGLTTTAVSNLLGMKPRGSDGDWLPPADSLYGVIEQQKADALPDRPRNSGPIPVVARVKAQVGKALGMSLEHDGVSVLITDMFGRPLEPPRRAPVPAGDFSRAMEIAVQLGTDLARKHGGARELAGIGLAVSAPLDVFRDARSGERRARFRMDLGPIVSVADFNTHDPLEAITNHLRALPDRDEWADTPVHIDNDANLGARAELNVGAAQGKRHVINLVWGQGIGAGLVFSGRVHHGDGGIAGEIGHIVLSDDPELHCPRCQRSCLEAEVSRLLDPEHAAPDVGKLIREALDGDEDASRRVEQAAEQIGRVLAMLITTYNPDRIVIGGDFGPEAYSLVIPPVQRVVERYAITNAARDVTLAIGRCGKDAAVIGAVWMVLARERIRYLLEVPAHEPDADWSEEPEVALRPAASDEAESVAV